MGEGKRFSAGDGALSADPGATMVQMVTYIGYRLRGFWGALLSSIAFVLPAFVALVILSALYFKMQTLPFIQVLFKVFGTIVIALVLNARYLPWQVDPQGLENHINIGVIVCRLLL